MWQKFLLYFLLLSFINTSLVPAENIDDTPFNGVEEVEEEYNTLFEFVKEKVLGFQDDTPEDEDDDCPDWQKKPNSEYHHYTAIFTFIISTYFQITAPPVVESTYISFLEISSPPPKVA